MPKLYLGQKQSQVPIIRRVFVRDTEVPKAHERGETMEHSGLKTKVHMELVTRTCEKGYEVSFLG